MRFTYRCGPATARRLHHQAGRRPGRVRRGLLRRLRRRQGGRAQAPSAGGPTPSCAASPLPQPQAPQPRPPVRPADRRARRPLGGHGVRPRRAAHAGPQPPPQRAAGRTGPRVVPASRPRPSATCTTTASSTATSSRRNIFIEHGDLKVGDYGLSKTVSASRRIDPVGQRRHRVLHGPGDRRRGNYTKQVDVYACGVMFYEMLTGEVPFRGDSWAEVALRHQTDTPELTRVPPEYLAIIEKALHKRPEQRYADLDEMIRAVEAVSRHGHARETEEPQLIAPTPRPRRSRPPSRRRCPSGTRRPCRGTGRRRPWPPSRASRNGSAS